MVNAFDLAAATYDSSFTNTLVGRLQRAVVYNYLDKYIGNNIKRNVLEINCGTGEDAAHIAQMGHTVLATDISHEMLSQAKGKVQKGMDVKFQQLDILNLNNQTFAKKFDLIFSNFGGLNCISPARFKKFLETSVDQLTSEGLLIAVIMPKKCLWERLYFILKGRRKKAFRRTTNEALETTIESKTVKTWYYNPNEITSFAKGLFTTELIKPVGFLIPPSYLNSFFKNKKWMLTVLGWMDRKLFRFSWLGAYSDHFIIVLKKK